jgi:P-type Ca2+ transporter type 2C
MFLAPLLENAAATTAWYWHAGDERWRTMVFTTLAFSQMAHVMAIRSSTDSLFTVGMLSNRGLTAAVAGAVLLQVVVVYVPLFNRLFDTKPLSGGDAIVATVLACVVFLVVEIEKIVRRHGERMARSASTKGQTDTDGDLGRT